MNKFENIVELVNQYHKLDVENIIDFHKFNQYHISHHSTSIEGSTLTFVETIVLLENGLTPKGKPLVHSLMQNDHYNALIFTLNKSKNKLYSIEFIKEINAHILKNTGQIYNTILGTVDSSKGEYRKGNVFAGQTTFVNFSKIDKLVEELCNDINRKLNENLSLIEKLQFSFEVHFRLVNIHPFYDGNGRTSRLLMNSIQSYWNLPLAIVFSSDKVDYINSIIESNEQNNLDAFHTFMFSQYEKHLNEIIKNIKKNL